MLQLVQEAGKQSRSSFHSLCLVHFGTKLIPLRLRFTYTEAMAARICNEVIRERTQSREASLELSQLSTWWSQCSQRDHITVERFYSFLHKQQRVWKNWFSKTRPQPDSERFINFLGIKLFVQAGGIMDWKAMPGVTCSPRWSTSRNWFRQPAQLRTKCTARSKQMSTVVNFGSDRSVHNDRRKLAGDPRMAFASTSRDYTSEESGSNSYIPQKNMKHIHTHSKQSEWWYKWQRNWKSLKQQAITT